MFLLEADGLHPIPLSRVHADVPACTYPVCLNALTNTLHFFMKADITPPSYVGDVRVLH
jgi:hypothetical protein